MEGLALASIPIPLQTGLAEEIGYCGALVLPDLKKDH